MADRVPVLHRLAARNVVVGHTDFLSLPLPLPWRITPAVVTPEVQTTLRAAARTWVASGETRHVVFDRARNLGLALVVRIGTGSPRLPRRAREVLDEGWALCNGHEARYRIVRRGRGFLMPGDEQILAVAFRCPVTQRGVAIEIGGACAEGDLRLFLAAMAGLECH
jgi:hypothetical protein